MSAVADEIALVETGGDVKEMEPVTVVAGKKKTKFAKKLNRNTVTYYQVLSIGAFVICVIIACVAFETYIHTFKLPTQPHHSAKDEKYHRHLVQMVNTPKSTWTAVYNPFASRSKEDEEGEENDESPEKMFLQMFADNREHMIQDTVTHATELMRLNMSIPAEYDVRKAYPQCWSVHQVYNQAGCGSCWAVAATSVMSDRVCISSNGSEQVQLSALDLTSCCHACGGCQGTHWSLSAFTYWKEEGLVSGGSFGTHEGCRPYSQEPDCGSPCTSTLYSKERTPKCERSCRQNYGIPYEEDKIYAQKAYWLRAAHGSGEFTPVKNILDQIAQDHYVELIQKEILLNGPVLGCFTLFEDFQHYFKGIYSTDDDRSEQLYGHCAKLLGWGSENGHKYWQYSNSWGRDWGEYGFFRISFDEVPEEVVAGLL